MAAAGSNGVILLSEDGITWTLQSSHPDTALYSIAYGNGKFVAVGDAGLLLVSSDGRKWTNFSQPTPIKSYSVCFGNGRFVIADVHPYAQRPISR